MKFWRKLSVGMRVALGVAVKAEELGLIKTKGTLKKVDELVKVGKAAAEPTHRNGHLIDP